MKQHHFNMTLLRQPYYKTEAIFKEHVQQYMDTTDTATLNGLALHIGLTLNDLKAFPTSLGFYSIVQEAIKTIYREVEKNVKGYSERIETRFNKVLNKLYKKDAIKALDLLNTVADTIEVYLKPSESLSELLALKRELHHLLK